MDTHKCVWITCRWLVVNHASIPESVLKKKSNAIAYHFLRENVAMHVIRIAYQETGTDKTDLSTKLQSPGPERQRLIADILF